MKIGVIHVESATQSVNHCICLLIDKALEMNSTITGIELGPGMAQATLKNWDAGFLSNWRILGGPLLRSSEVSQLERSVFKQFDALVVFGGRDCLALFDKFLTPDGPRFLFVPASIYNDVEGSQFSLGFDTALNSIVKNIIQVKDTASSLIYDHPRLFCIQVPGDSSSKLLLDTALALEGDVLDDERDPLQLARLVDQMKRKYQSGESYSLVFVHEGVNPAIIQQHLEGALDVDFKVVQFDETLCMGAPTAADRVLSVKLGNTISKWLQKTNASSGKLVISGIEQFTVENLA